MEPKELIYLINKSFGGTYFKLIEYTIPSYDGYEYILRMNYLPSNSHIIMVKEFFLDENKPKDSKLKDFFNESLIRSIIYSKETNGDIRYANHRSIVKTFADCKKEISELNEPNKTNE